MRIMRIAAMLALVASTGCSSPLEPGEVAGVYVSRAPSGGLPPGFLLCPCGTTRLLVDTLSLQSDGLGTRRTTLEYISPDASDPVIVKREERIFYVIEGGRISVDVVCELSCIGRGPSFRWYRVVDDGLLDVGGGIIYDRRADLD